MNRECNKSVYHASGSCSAWECKGTKTVEDVIRETRKEVLDEVYVIAINENHDTLIEWLQEHLID